MPWKMQNDFLASWSMCETGFLTFYFQLYYNQQNNLESSMAFLILGHVKKIKYVSSTASEFSPVLFFQKSN